MNHEVFLNSLESLNESELRAKLPDFLNALESGQLRAALQQADGSWHADIRVKKAILQCFRLGQVVAMGSPTLPFYDKDLLPVQQFAPERKVRIVPGGSSVRRGAFLGSLVTLMPPSYVNVGAYVDEGTLVDSHALVGSCAQIGRRVHLSAAAQIGGVLEPIGALPVIVEDDVFIGGNSGLYEGTIVRSRAVIGAGVVLTASSRVYDLPNGRILTSEETGHLEIPPGAVVIMGSRPARGEFAAQHHLQISTPIIVKYRDEKTDTKAALESALR